MVRYARPLAKKVLLDFFQKIASPSFRQAESWQSPRSLAAASETSFQKKGRRARGPSRGVLVWAHKRYGGATTQKNAKHSFSIQHLSAEC